MKECTSLIHQNCGCAKDRQAKSSDKHPYDARKQPWVAEREALKQTAKKYQDAVPELKGRKLSGLATDIYKATQDPEQAAILLKMLKGSLAVDDFSEFCKQAWHTVEPSTTLDWNWHHQLVCDTLQAMFECWLKGKAEPEWQQPVLNVIFNLCPGSLKSRVISVFYNAWCWLRAPSMKFICLSVNEEACFRDARATRTVIKSAWYQKTFNPSWTLRGDQDAVSNFANTAAGERLSRASGSEIVGLRADVLLGDDMNNPLNSHNKLERERVNTLYQTNQHNRVNDGSRSMRIMVQQRVHMEDHTGYVIKKDGLWSTDKRFGWLHVVVPAEYDPARKFVMPACLQEILLKKLPTGRITQDIRTEVGESVHPKRYPKEFLEAERARWAGTGNYAGQMQQTPTLAEGGMVKRDYFNWFRLASGVRDDIDELPTGRPRPSLCGEQPAQIVPAAIHRPGHWDLDWVVISMDCAAKKTDRGSQWGMLVIGGKGGKRYILDDRTQRGDILEILLILRELVALWQPDKILVEDKAAGPDLIIRLKESMKDGGLKPVIIEPINPGRSDKTARLMAVIPIFANSMVYLRDGAPWVEAFVEELCSYPAHAVDDRVDSCVQALQVYMMKDSSYSLPAW